MSICVKETQVGGVTVVAISGRITMGEGAGRFRDTILRLIQEDKKAVLVDLGETSYTDSTGLAELVSGFSTVANCGGQLKLLNLTKRIRELLLITHLYSIFEVFEDQAEAVKSFGQ